MCTLFSETDIFKDQTGMKGRRCLVSPVLRRYQESPLFFSTWHLIRAAVEHYFKMTTDAAQDPGNETLGKLRASVTGHLVSRILLD